jgi:alkaline phosphatase D
MRIRWLSFAVVVAFWVVVPNPTLAQQKSDPKVIGPMVGHVTATEAHLWAYTGHGATLEIHCRPEADAAAPPAVVPMTRLSSELFAGRATLTNLQPATSYRYELFCNGQTKPAWRGRFTTAPPTGAPARFKMAFSACVKLQENRAQESWKLLHTEQPAFHLLLGDNVYANTTNRFKIWEMHIRQRQVKNFAAVIRTVPTYAMWDDHDYATNDSDGTACGKENSLRAFKELFANPSAGAPETPGAFYRFSWGNVDFFVLDGRYHRSPNGAPNDANKRLLGDVQFQWLADGLKSSKAAFKVLAMGSTMMAPADSWQLYDFERERLFRTIMENKIGGVLYLSGDLHACLMFPHLPRKPGWYTLYEIVSSGIAHSPEEGFVTLEFDTTVPDPTVRVRIIWGNGSVPLDTTLRLSELQVKDLQTREGVAPVPHP